MNHDSIALRGISSSESDNLLGRCSRP